MTAERTILITGAAQGIGRAMALHLAAPGTRLLLHYRASREAARGLAQLLARRGRSLRVGPSGLREVRHGETLYGETCRGLPMKEHAAGGHVDG